MKVLFEIVIQIISTTSFRNFTKRSVVKYPESPALVPCATFVKLSVCDFKVRDSG